jgi:hypothetical protein
MSTPPRVKATLINLRAVLDWQDAGVVHPLTCGTDSCRADLLPSVDPGGWLSLRCPVCDLVQTWVPDVVLNAPPHHLAQLRQAVSGDRSATTR